MFTYFTACTAALRLPLGPFQTLPPGCHCPPPPPPPPLPPAHLLDVLLHPVIVAIHAVAPYVGLLGHELAALQQQGRRQGSRSAGAELRGPACLALTMRSKGMAPAAASLPLDAS